VISASPDPLRLSRLLDAGRALVAEHDPQAVLSRTLAAAREVTGAGFAALMILDEGGLELEQFLTVGVDEQTRTAIADLPRLRGLLGVPIAEARPLRLGDVSRDPRHLGFPEGHPPMRGFLGVPVLIRGVPSGALYLAEKQSGEFTGPDEEAAVILADWVAVAIETARLYEHNDRRQIEHAQAVRDLETTSDVAIAVGAETGLERVLRLIIQRGRDLIDAGHVDAGGRSLAGEELLRAFAGTAATALAMAQSVESDRLRSLMAAGDAERRRWARELHDETLQGLGAVRLLLASARRRGDPRQIELAMDEAIGQVEQEIENLHAIISDLRPAALDELGLRPALEALLERRSDPGELVIVSTLMLPDPRAGEQRLEPEIESTVYRVVQEALTNIVKHANARNVRVAVMARAGAVSIEVRDDGVGFAPAARGSGFGLAGMRERVYLAGGTVRVDSGAGGTRVRAELPAHAGGRRPGLAGSPP
jgi:signal transduction histidine kinase